MKQSESIKELASALCDAQAEMPVVAMDSVNPFLKNKFASLGAIIRATRPVLTKHGLAVSQFTTTDGLGGIGVTTMLMHLSGEWLSDTAILQIGEEKGKSAAQVAGSIITYLRRYTYSSVIGIVTEDDEDGATPQTKKEPAQKDSGVRKWTIPQKDAIVEADLAENMFEAEKMLNLSNLSEKAPAPNIVWWAKQYRQVREEGLEPHEAAIRANDEYTAEKNRRLQDKAGE